MNSRLIVNVYFHVLSFVPFAIKQQHGEICCIHLFSIYMELFEGRSELGPCAIEPLSTYYVVPPEPVGGRCVSIGYTSVVIERISYFIDKKT